MSSVGFGFERTTRGRRAPAWGVSAAAMAIGVACPTVAAAQGLVRSLNYELSARAQYDSNVARASKKAALADNVEPADVRYTLSGTVNGSRPIGRQMAYIVGSVSYDFYDKNESLKRWRANVNGGVSGRVGPCASGVTGSYVRALSDLSPISLTDPRNSIETLVSYGANISCPLVGRIAGSAGVQRSQIRTSGSRVQVGSETTSVTTGVGYVSRTLGSLSLTGGYTTTDYKAPPQPIPFAPQGVETYSVGLQYSRPIGTRLTGSANVSHFELSQKGSALSKLLTGDDTSGITWGVSLGYKASTRLNINASYSDSTTATARIASAYQHQKRANLGLRYQVSRQLSTSLSAGRTKRDFSGVLSQTLGVAARSESLHFAGGLAYDLTRNVSISADASRSKVKTDQALLDYTSDSGSITIIARF